MQDAIIGAITLAGILVVAASAPNAMRLLKHAPISSRDPRQRFRECISKMKRKGLVRWKVIDGNYVLELTAEGKEYAERIHLRMVEIKKPRRWDGMWRMIIFDIPERKRNVRDKVRRLLTDLGLYRLQDSVWVHPYDFEEITVLLKKDLKMGSEMRYVVAAAIEWDDPIRERFSLPKV